MAQRLSNGFFLKDHKLTFFLFVALHFSVLCNNTGLIIMSYGLLAASKRVVLERGSIVYLHYLILFEFSCLLLQSFMLTARYLKLDASMNVKLSICMLLYCFVTMCHLWMMTMYSVFFLFIFKPMLLTASCSFLNGSSISFLNIPISTILSVYTKWLVGNLLMLSWLPNMMLVVCFLSCR